MKEEYIEFLLYCPSYYINQGYETRGQIKLELTELKARIHSNEIGRHNRPHVHVDFKNNGFVCSIDSKIQIIEPEHCPIGIAKRIEYVIAENLSKCRKEWNRCQTLIKFTENEINFNKIQFKHDNNGINVII